MTMEEEANEPMQALNWMWGSLAVAVLAFAPLACSDATSGDDGGLDDGADAGEVDPCEAAAPLWNEIWSTSLESTGIEGITPDTNLMDTWGSSANDIYAVGFKGTILHFDGSSWTQMQSGTEANLEGVWGYVIKDDTGAVLRTDVFAAGSDGTILRYNGQTWGPTLVINDPDSQNPDPQPVTGNFHAIWGIPAASGQPDAQPDVVAVGGDGLIVRWDPVARLFLEMRLAETFVDSQGNTRTSYVRFSPERLGGVFGTGSLADPLFVAVGNNGSILEMQAGTWTRNQNFTPPGAFITHLNGVWGRGAWEIFATGIEGTVVLRDNGGTWHVLKKENPLYQLDPTYLRGFWAFYQSYCGDFPEVPDGGEPPDPYVRDDTSWAIFIGWNGSVMMGHDGIICPVAVPTSSRLEGIWGMPPRPEADRLVDGGPPEGGAECDPVEVIIVGVNGTILRLSNPEGR